MTRSEFVRLLVLDAICDDFENVDQCILPTLAETGCKCGLIIDRPEIVDALGELVRDGLAKAYDLSGCGRDTFSGEIHGMPSLDVVEEDFHTYFYITQKGKDLHSSDDTWWPFDEVGSPRSDWQAPQD
jgi:hypothetical protein